MAEEQHRLSLGWQVVLLLVCVYLGSKLTAVYGTRLADALGIDFFFGRTMIDIVFAAIVAILGVLAYRGVDQIKRVGRKGRP